MKQKAPWVLACLVASAGCRWPVLLTGSGPAERRTISLTGVDGAVEEGRLLVPENRELKGGRRISISLVVLPSTGRDRHVDPLVVLPGGPGQAATENTRYFAELFSEVRKHRDVVLVDPRGTGLSSPLRYTPPADRLLDEPGALIPSSWVAAIRTELEAKADLACYTTREVVEDLDDLTRAMGWPVVNLYGTSYGTRVAQAYMAAYPERVRTATLKGVVPPGLGVGQHYGVDAQASLDRLFEGLARDPKAMAAAPDPSGAFHRVLVALETHPVSVSVTHPTTGVPVVVPLTRDGFSGLVRTLLYAPSTRSLIPKLITGLEAGDHSLVGPLLVKARMAALASLHAGPTLSTLAAEDARIIREGKEDPGVQATFLRNSVRDQVLEATKDWPVKLNPPKPGGVGKHPIPTLMISGALDPATPPLRAQEASHQFSRVRHLVFEEAGHSGEGFSPCLGRLLAAFVEAGSTVGWSPDCAGASLREGDSADGGKTR